MPSSLICWHQQDPSPPVGESLGTCWALEGPENRLIALAFPWALPSTLCTREAAKGPGTTRT